MGWTNQNWNVVKEPLASVTPTMTNKEYTFPTFAEAKQCNELINPASGLRFCEVYAVEELPPTFGNSLIQEIRLDTGAQITFTEFQTLKIARRLIEVLRNLDRVAALPDNWDTYNGGKTSEAAAKTAQDLVWNAVIRLGRSKAIDGTPYDVAPISGGGVQLEWRGNGGILEVEISSERRFNYLLWRHRDRLGDAEEAANVSEEKILALISSVHK